MAVRRHSYQSSAAGCQLATASRSSTEKLAYVSPVMAMPGSHTGRPVPKIRRSAPQRLGYVRDGIVTLHIGGLQI